MSHGLGFCHENSRTGPVKGLNGLVLRLIIVNTGDVYMSTILTGTFSDFRWSLHTLQGLRVGGGSVMLIWL